MLADKQAALEKLEWEAKMSNRKIEELQGDVDSMDFEITALMKAFEKLSENDSATYSENGISSSLEFEPLQLAVSPQSLTVLLERQLEPFLILFTN